MAFWRLFLCSVGCCLGAWVDASAHADAPNIVLILADDLGYSDTEPYGSEIETPAISALAAEGVKFTNHHMAGSCAPTRGMLLTGVDSHRNGVPNIPESIPPEQAEHANYRGALGDNVVTIATILRDAGYHTYMTGKWHLGNEPEQRPFYRGFERTVSMAVSGADHFEQKPYLPAYKEAYWYEDGENLTLPEGFYTPKYLVDRAIEFVDENRADGKPFFSYIPFLAVHFPVQAPREYTERNIGKYDEGWTKLREARLARAQALGIVPEGIDMVTMSTTEDWDALSDDERKYNAKAMAVYAGMLQAMDDNIARFVAYLKEIGEYENTVFIFSSDNGAESTRLVSGARGLYMRGWMAFNGYNTDYATLGEKGSFLEIGPSFASAAVSPLAYYKFFAHDGGLRVPMIVAGAGVAGDGRRSNAFTHVTDLAPTILDLAGVDVPDGNYQGRTVERMIGTSLVPLLTGEAERAHDPAQAIGYELAGNAALFQGDYKIVKDRGPVGDDEWHLFNFVSDPGETADLKEKMPERFSAMMDAYRDYVRDNDVLPMPKGYDQRREVIWYAFRNNPNYAVLTTAAVVLVLLFYLLWLGLRGIARRVGR
ncbi:MAG: arylsulfatase [Myxococcota bacterium]